MQRLSFTKLKTHKPMNNRKKQRNLKGKTVRVCCVIPRRLYTGFKGKLELLGIKNEVNLALTKLIYWLVYSGNAVDVSRSLSGYPGELRITFKDRKHSL